MGLHFEQKSKNVSQRTFQGYQRKMETRSGYEAFKAKNPEWPEVNDVTIEYVLGDEKFTCTAWFDGKAEPACVVDFSYMGDMENSILDKKYLVTTGYEDDCIKFDYKCAENPSKTLKTQRIKCGGGCDKISISDEANGISMSCIFAKC